MSEPITILLRHFIKAESDRRLHISRQHKGNIEAALAGHKSAWLRDLISEIGGPEAVAQAEAIRKGGAGPMATESSVSRERAGA